MNDVRTVAELERVLKTTEPASLQPVRLGQIRNEGRRRRRTRLAVTAGGAVAVVVLASAVAAGVTRGHDSARDPSVAQQPKVMTPLARRVLAEVPGARQVSSWQVVIPAPSPLAADRIGAEPVPDGSVAAGPVDIGTRWYTGVTTFPRRDFPAWLHDGTERYEKTVLGDADGYPVGSTGDGVVVDGGPLRLACIASEIAGDPCHPAMVSGPDHDLTYQWGMGADHFLEKGHDLQLFSTHTYTSGSAATVWIGGADGTDVASVDLVTTDGTSVRAHVESGTFVPGDTMFWAVVDGELAQAVTRDADGNVLERHVLEPCDSPVACEVR
jgi:hypothetical protein